jgi:NADPH:quinone reductase
VGVEGGTIRLISELPCSNESLVHDFSPIGYLPNGVRLTAYGGESSDLPAEVLQRVLDQIAAR